MQSGRICWKGNRRERKEGCAWKQENFRQKEGDIKLEEGVDSEMQEKNNRSKKMESFQKKREISKRLCVKSEE